MTLIDGGICQCHNRANLNHPEIRIAFFLC